MSSYLSKSKKEFKPKIGPRRSGATAVTLSVASSPSNNVRASVERQSSQLQSAPSLDLQQASPPPTAVQRHSQPIPSSAASQLRIATSSTSDEPFIRRRGRSPESQRAPAEGELSGSDSRQHSLSNRRAVTGEGFEGARKQQSVNGNLLPTPSPTQQSSRPSRVEGLNDGIGIPPSKARKRRRDENNSAEVVGRTRGIRTEGVEDESETESVERSEARRGNLQTIERSGPEALTAEADAEGAEATNDRDGSPRKKVRRQRASTPDGAESVEITPTVVKMAELTKDTRLGKKSTREKRLQDKDREAAKQRKLDAQSRAREEAADFMADPTTSSINGQQSPQTNGVTAAATTTVIPPEPNPAPTRLAPRVRVVNGQIIQDEDSRILDRHAPAAAEREEGAAIEEDELTRHVNSGSYMRRERQTKWNAEETERFYQGLRWFGTDFQTISKMFPGRSRRQIKLKYNKEDRNPASHDVVHRALIEEKEPADLAAFQRYAQIDLQDPETLQKDLDNDRKELEEAQARETAQLEEMRQQREADAAREAEAHNVALAEAQIQHEQATAVARATETTSKPARKGVTTTLSAAVPAEEAEESGEEPESNHDIISGKLTRRAQASAKNKGSAMEKGKAKAKAKGKGKGKELDTLPNHDATEPGLEPEPETAPPATTSKSKGRGKGKAKATTSAAVAQPALNTEPEPPSEPPSTEETIAVQPTKTKGKGRAPRAKATAASTTKGKGKGKEPVQDQKASQPEAHSEVGNQSADEESPEESIVVATVPVPKPKATRAPRATKKAVAGAAQVAEQPSPRKTRGKAKSKPSAKARANANEPPMRVEKSTRRRKNPAATPAAPATRGRRSRKSAAGASAAADPAASSTFVDQDDVDALLRAAGEEQAG